MDVFADDAVIWIAGSIPKISGTHSKTEILGNLKGILGYFKDGWRLTMKGMTAEGDRVAVEAESYGTLLNGKVYNTGATGREIIFLFFAVKFPNKGRVRVSRRKRCLKKLLTT